MEKKAPEQLKCHKEGKNEAKKMERKENEGKGRINGRTCAGTPRFANMKKSS